MTQQPDWSTGTANPITLHPPEFVELDEAHKREAINALADLLVPILRSASNPPDET